MVKMPKTFKLDNQMVILMKRVGIMGGVPDWEELVELLPSQYGPTSWNKYYADEHYHTLDNPRGRFYEAMEKLKEMAEWVETNEPDLETDIFFEFKDEKESVRNADELPPADKEAEPVVVLTDEAFAVLKAEGLLEKRVLYDEYDDTNAIGDDDERKRSDGERFVNENIFGKITEFGAENVWISYKGQEVELSDIHTLTEPIKKKESSVGKTIQILRPWNVFGAEEQRRGSPDGFGRFREDLPITHYWRRGEKKALDELKASRTGKVKEYYERKEEAEELAQDEDFLKDVADEKGKSIEFVREWVLEGGDTDDIETEEEGPTMDESEEEELAMFMANLPPITKPKSMNETLSLTEGTHTNSSIQEEMDAFFDEIDGM